MDRLQQLLEDGVIDEVYSQLKSGKEADVWLVSHRGEPVAAKLYKAREFRSFKNDAGYKEGRQVRNTRTQRAMDKGSRFGRTSAEEAWKSAEADAMFTLHAAGVKVPKPVLFYEGVLLMEVIGDAEGRVAPRLVDAGLTKEQAEPLYRVLRGELIKMLCADLIHGDLSEFNVLLGASGPVIIDFPQVVAAAKNSRSEQFLKRDVANLLRFFSTFDASLAKYEGDGDEIWRAYVRRDLSPNFEPRLRPPGSSPQRPAHHGGRRDERRGGPPPAQQGGGRRGGPPPGASRGDDARGGPPPGQQGGGRRGGPPPGASSGGGRPGEPRGGPPPGQQGGGRRGGPPPGASSGGGRPGEPRGGPPPGQQGGGRRGGPPPGASSGGDRPGERRAAPPAGGRPGAPPGASSGAGRPEERRAEAPAGAQGGGSRHGGAPPGSPGGGGRPDERRGGPPPGQQGGRRGGPPPGASSGGGRPEERRSGPPPGQPGGGGRHGGAPPGASSGGRPDERRGGPPPGQQGGGRRDGPPRNAERRDGGRAPRGGPEVTYTSRPAPEGRPAAPAHPPRGRRPR